MGGTIIAMRTSVGEGVLANMLAGALAANKPHKVPDGRHWPHRAWELVQQSAASR